MFVSRIGKLALLLTLTVAGSTATVRVQTIAPGLYADLSWRCIGPFDGGPIASVAGVPGEAGVYTITTPSGGAWKTVDGGGTWLPIDRQNVATGSDPRRWTDPANPRRIVRAEAQGIAVSLDAGQTWVSSGKYLPIAEVASLAPRSVKIEANTPKVTIAGKPVNVSIADPARAGLIFAGTNDGVYVSFDSGVDWESLRLNMPVVVVNDLDIRGSDLVAATQGRSVWELFDISPLRQMNAATSSAAAVLFKPADAAVWPPTPPDPGESMVYRAATGGAGMPANLDYYLGAAATGEVRLEILDATGRVIHAATSTITQSSDSWLPVMQPLSAAAGHHRIEWNLRLDPPPAQKHRFARMAPALSDTPADPDGPVVLPGTYRVKLTVAGATYTQPLVVKNDPYAGKFAMLAAQRRQFDLAMKMYDAMQIAHQEFVQLARLRSQLRPILTSPDPQVALAAVDLDKRLAEIDGSDWTGLVIPDADDEAGEVDEKEGKHPDFVPPKPVSVSKDYDDPTSILGRRFANVDHTPAFATISATLSGMISKIGNSATAADAPADDYARSCELLSGVLDTWRAVNAQDVPRLNCTVGAAASATTANCRARLSPRLRGQITVARWTAALAACIGAVALVAAHSGAEQTVATVPPAAVIQHIVVIFQENVSFDHYFATYPRAANLPGETPFTALPGTPPVAGLTGTLLTANPNFTNPANGSDAANPRRLSRSEAATADQDHSYTQMQLAYNHGKMDLFPATVGQFVAPDGSLALQANKGLNLAYFDGNTVAAIWNYAQRFSMSDHFFQTTFGPSVPAALNLISGQTNGVTHVKNGASPNVLIDGGAGSFTVIGDVDPIGDICSSSKRIQVTMGGRNIGDLLNAANVSWGWFEEGFDVNVRNPNGTTGCARDHTSTVTNLASKDYIAHHEPFQYYPSTANLAHVRPSSVATIGRAGDAANHQYDLTDFFAAADAGHFPAVAFLKPAAYQNGHAGYSDPIDEQTFLVRVLNDLQQRPEWKNTAVFLTWDDSDGWYDHLMGPIVNSSVGPIDALDGDGVCGDGTSILPGVSPANRHALGRCGYGPRLPLLAISPWARRNVVDSTNTNVASITRFIEDVFLDGRRIGGGSFDAISGPLNHLFDFQGTPNTTPLLLDERTGHPLEKGQR